jgi:hypothetical protein
MIVYFLSSDFPFICIVFVSFIFLCASQIRYCDKIIINNKMSDV